MRAFLKELNLPKNIATKYAQVLDKLLNYGFTTVSSLGYSLPLESAKKLSYKNSEPRIRQFIYLTENELNYLPSKVDHSDPFFRVQGIKLWHDGSPYTGNMFISSLYMDSKLNKDLGITPGTHGEPALTTEYLIQKIKYFSSKGWQIAIHTQGDASNKAVYDAIEKVGEIPKNAGPIRIEHLVMLPKDLLKSFALKGVTTSFHINHILYYGDALKNSIVGSAIDTALPVKAAFESNMHPTLHADSPMFSPEPFSLMKTAITRKTNSGATINPEQAITIQQAMRALTINGAYQLGIEKNAGSLEPNKWADFVILSNNPYEVPVDKLSEITIDSVYVAGKKKY